jgi:CO/xanthine dehydrogenase FAD-binding subunit
MIALTAARDPTSQVREPDGNVRGVAKTELLMGPQRSARGPGEILRGIDIPASALRRRTAFRRIALSPEGRSGALVIGTRDRAGAFALTVTASTPRPVQFPFENLPTAAALQQAIAAAIPEDGWYDDVHGAPDWRRHVTERLAEEIREELAR